MNNNDKGKIGEDIAKKFLEKNDYKILQKNYRISKMGEIDIIAFKDNTICFVEVKLRNSDRYGSPIEAVNENKANKIRRISTIYLKNNNIMDNEIRYDVIGIKRGKNKDYIIEHLKNAF
jgi:putative endonuclease